MCKELKSHWQAGTRTLTAVEVYRNRKAHREAPEPRQAKCVLKCQMYQICFVSFNPCVGILVCNSGEDTPNFQTMSALQLSIMLLVVKIPGSFVLGKIRAVL